MCLTTALLSSFIAFTGLAQAAWNPADFPPQPPVKALSAQEEAKTFTLPPGYHMQLVLSEPEIKEPVTMAFDGNGRLFVAEMLSYMQDINATGEMEPISRVSMHWSSKGDGVFDKHTVFADKLKLPRLLLPMADGVLIGETDTNDLYLYRDTNGDDVSDEKKLVYSGGPRGGNLEHQPSGLTMAIDNWLYMASNDYRLRWKDGQLIKQDIPGNGGQWGATQDDDGKLWVVNAGGERGPVHFQQHTLYGNIFNHNEFEPGFEVVWPAMGLRDFQGGPDKAREDNTLNHFTATCGGEIYRGDQLPSELRGNLFFCEPVGRLLRRTQIEVTDGMTILHNPYPQNEFMRSTDACFRPVDMKTGPDGTLYIADMYRGIIQEGAWVMPGQYLTLVIQQHSMDKVIGRGRIWRLVHDTTKPVATPKLLDASPADLVATLEHPNGWHRDTAQKLLVMKHDVSVVPALNAMARNSANPLARMHAMWTLEGLDALTADTVRAALKDKEPRVRHAGIRASETLLKAGDETLKDDVMALAKDADASVAIQVLLTSKLLNWKDYKKFVNSSALAHLSKGVKEVAAQIVTGNADFPRDFNKAQKDVLAKGQSIYQQLCYTCHGLDGNGTIIQGPTANSTIALAPPLSKSKLVLGPKEGILRALLQGVTGPVNGKTYQGQMIPMSSNDDAWIAAVTSYVRNRLGNSVNMIEPDDVAKARQQTAERKQPWTEEELFASCPSVLVNRKEWKITASHKSEEAARAIDGKQDTRWDSVDQMNNKMWLTIELPAETLISGIRLDGLNSNGHFARGVKIEVSSDGSHWGKPVFDGSSVTSISDIFFAPTKAKFIKVNQTNNGGNKTTWAIHEIDIYTAPTGSPTTAGN